MKQISKISETAIFICLRFVYLTSGKMITWAEFLKNQSKITKAITENLFCAEKIPEDRIGKLIETLKKYESLSVKLKKSPKIFQVMLDFIRWNIEYKLKYEAQKSSLKKEILLSKKIQQYENQITEIKSEIEQLESKLMNYKQDIWKSAHLNDSFERKNFRNQISLKYLANPGNATQKSSVQIPDFDCTPINSSMYSLNLNPQREKELDKMSHPTEYIAYIRKYVKNDLKELGISVSSIVNNSTIIAHEADEIVLDIEENIGNIEIAKSEVHKNDIKIIDQQHLNYLESHSCYGTNPAKEHKNLRKNKSSCGFYARSKDMENNLTDRGKIK